MDNSKKRPSLFGDISICRPGGQFAVLETRIPVNPSRRPEAGRARVAHYDPRSAASVAFHRAVDELFPLGKSGPSMLCVTSAVRGQGRSLCAANLAITLANTNRRVLLVDADAFHMQQRAIFHDSEFDADDSTIRPTDVPGLDLHAEVNTACASTERGTMTLAALEGLRPLLNDGYDVLVIDAPPICEWGDATSRTPLEQHLLMLQISDLPNLSTVTSSGGTNGAANTPWHDSPIHTRVLLNRAGNSRSRGSGLAARFWVR